MEELPYGTWPSTIDAHVVARGGSRRFGSVNARGGRIRWSESRPDEDGRIVVVDAGLGDLTPVGSNARTRVHEYGGGAVWYHGDTVFYSEFADSRVYRVDGSDVRPITPEPPVEHGLRFADGVVTPDGSTIICVRERHDGGEVINELVSFPADGSGEVTIVHSGHDFYMAPKLDPSGERLAWIAWDHVNMPWDGTWLYLDGEVIAGAVDESVIDPQWSPDGKLHWLSDRTGWWNIYREGERLTALDDAEIGGPAWVFGMHWYVFLGDGRIACVVTRNAVESLHILDAGKLADAGLGWTSFASTAFAADGSTIVFAVASPTEALMLASFDVDTGEETVVRGEKLDIDPASVSIPRAIEFPTGDGVVAHAFYYPPSNAGYKGPDDETPPLQVIAHGGPTAHVTPHLQVDMQYWTQRGIGVVDVNYRGSTGYGREYRRLLNGRWGEIDWADCVSAARHLAREGEVDVNRTWVEGGSAGGYVVMCALVYDPTAFAAGVSWFGVADVEALELDTHKFESHYSDRLIGPYPERADLYRERSPVHFVDRLERPMLVLQGLDDKVVLPAQAEMMVEVLERKGIPHAYIAFEGEGHGFRKEENIIRSHEAVLSFIGQVFGFEPADDIEPVALTGALR